MSSPQPVFGEAGPVYLTTEEVAARFRQTTAAIKQWRYRGIGPQSVKYGRTVLYPLPEVERFEREQLEKAGIDPETMMGR